MDWEAFVALLKAHPKKTVAAVISVFAIGSSMGAWMLQAEQCHAQSKQNEKDIRDLIEYQKLEIERRESEAEMERKRLKYIAELCLAGKLKDKAECAKAGVPSK